MTSHPQDTAVALVTGAAQGIGRCIARRLLRGGYDVWCFDCDADALAQMQESLPAGVRSNVHPYAGDIAAEADVAGCIADIRSAHGRLDVLVNNAGIADPVNPPIEAFAIEDWERIIRVNLTGYFIAAKRATALLRAAGGCIVNMASTRALQSEPNTEAYAASKGGITALTHALAVSLGPAVRVNAIAPGWIDVRGEQKDAESDAESPAPLREVDHDQHPAGRVGTGDDIAALTAFLCSDAAGFITGQTLVADGGMTRKMIYAH